jgi:hypothetical protein
MLKKVFMKKLFIHVAIALLLIFLINQFAIHAGKTYKDGASIICEQKRLAVRNDQWKVSEEKPTVLFFGASGILSAIIPTVFDSILDHQTYSLNLALPALPIGPYYHCLLDYLEHNDPPEYIILTYHIDSEEVILFNSYANQGINFPDELFSYFIHRKDKNQMLNYLLPLHVYKEPVFKYMYNSVLDPSDIQENRERNARIVNRMIENRGYYFIIEQSKYPDGRLPDDYKEESDSPERPMKMYDPGSDVYVEKFFSLTKKLGTQVLLVNYPVRQGKYKQFNKTPKEIQKLLKTYDNVSISKDGWKIPFFENKYFSDPHHLNKWGAEMYTKQVATDFKAVYLSDTL